jgi:lipopolysaccharide biosynthesis regulator YciM
MTELLWLLIPLAAASGWYAAIRTAKNCSERSASLIPDEYIKGLNFLLNEQPDKALEVFMRIVEVDSDTVETHIVLGNLFRRRGEVERAIRIHQNLVVRRNLSLALRANALLELGRDYLRAGLLDRAESVLKEVVQMGGQATQAYRHLRDIYEQEKDWTNAIETAVRLHKECGVPQGEVIAHYHCELGELAIADGRCDAAFQHAKKALNYDRACARASILLGDLAASKADYKAAIKFYSDVHAQRQEFVPLVLPKLEHAHAMRSDDNGYLNLLAQIRRDNNSMSVALSMVKCLKGKAPSALDEVFAVELSRPLVPLRLIREYVRAKLESNGQTNPVLHHIAGALDSHLECLTSHLCLRCGLETKGLFWQCPSCHRWSTIMPIDLACGARKLSRAQNDVKASHGPI